MKVLNKENQHEIGFDIDCLYDWAKYIAKDGDEADTPNVWYQYKTKPLLGEKEWEYPICHRIYTDQQPKRFKGHWTESLFKIERK